MGSQRDSLFLYVHNVKAVSCNLQLVQWALACGLELPSTQVSTDHLKAIVHVTANVLYLAVTEEVFFVCPV